MKRLLVLAGLLIAVTGTTALAQEGTPPPAPSKDTVTKRVSDTLSVTLPVDHPLVMWPSETIVTGDGSFAKAYFFATEADIGYVPLTPCDNIAISCEPVLVRIEGIAQGKALVATFEEAP